MTTQKACEIPMVVQILQAYYGYNNKLLNATRYYYSATAPTTSGNYWHYVNGKPTPW